MTTRTRPLTLTPSVLRRIIAEEVAAAAGTTSPHLMTPEEEVSLSKRRPAKGNRSKGSVAAPEGSFEDFERGYKQRELDRRWDALTKRWPRLTAEVGREAFEAEYAARREGTSYGGSSLGSGDIYSLLLDLLEAM